MPQQTNHKQLKKLALFAKNNINSELHLQQTKQLCYTEKHYFALMLILALFCTFAEGGGQIVNWFGHLPKGDTLLNELQKLDEKDIKEQFRKLFEKQFRSIFKIQNKRRRLILAIDATDKPTYSKKKRDDENIVGGKRKASTNFFFRFASIQIADKKNPLTLHVMHCTKNTTNEQIIEELITEARKFVRIKYVLIDRGFYSTDVFNKLEQMNVKYLMPSKHDEKTEKMFKEHLQSDYEVKPYFCSNNKKEFADFRLIMIRLEDNKEIGYVTNMTSIKEKKAAYYIKLYQRRWNIETGYRMQNMFLAKTCSINPSVRLFYFCYAVALHNQWIIMKKNGQEKGFNVPVLLFLFMLIIVVIVEFLDVEKIMEIS